jgi:DNA-binding protein HU-beta
MLPTMKMAASYKPPLTCLLANPMIFITLQEIHPMIKMDIINEVSKAADITKVRAEVAVEAVLDAMKASMMRGERIELRGFGVFLVRPRKRGIGRNPRTGKEVRIPPGRTIRFKPGKDLQNLSHNPPQPASPVETA